MSDCNYCRFQQMKRRGCHVATAQEAKRLWEAEEGFTKAFGDGVVIVDKEGAFAAWLMELPTHCCC